MDKWTLIAKTINKKRGYKYYTYRTEYDNDIIRVYHYGTLILEFSITKKLDNNEYVKLGGAWSYSDKMTIWICLYHIRDFTRVEYACYSYNSIFTPKGKMRKYYKTHYYVVDNNYCVVILKRKPPNNYTLFNYPPYSTIRKRINTLIEKKRKELEQKIKDEINKGIEYLKTFTKYKNIEFDKEKGIILNLPNRKILIRYDGLVIDLKDNKGICIQIDNRQNLNYLDIMLTKAIGIYLYPRVLEQGIKFEIGDKNYNYALLENSIIEKELDKYYRSLRKYEETKTHDYLHKKRKYRYKNFFLNSFIKTLDNFLT